MSEHQTYKDHKDKYSLSEQDHRYHLIHKASSIPAGGAADRIHSQLESHMERVRQDAERYSKPSTGFSSNGRLIEIPPRIDDPQGFVDAYQRVVDFLPHLTQHILDGPRGEQSGVQAALNTLKLHYDPEHNNCSFIRDPAYGPEAKKHRIVLGPTTLLHALHKDTNGIKYFEGAEHLMSPELVSMHEMGHVLDWGIGNSHPQETSFGFHRGSTPGMKLGYGLNFQHTHDGLAKYAQDGGIADMPPPYSRLHYPTFGSLAPGDSWLALQRASNPFEEQMLADRKQRVMEWPTVLSEYAAADPSALDALDTVLGRNKEGKGHREMVSEFWGFPFKSVPDAHRTEQLAKILQSTLKTGPKQRSFVGFKDASGNIPPESWRK